LLLCLYLVTLPPDLAIGFVDRLKQRSEAWRVIYWPKPLETIPELIKIALRQQPDGDYAFAVHACCPTSHC
jgi:hypothetical protein